MKKIDWNIVTGVICIILFLVVLSFVAFGMGQRHNRNEVVTRAKMLSVSDCHSEDELEYVIFGSSQE